jgi:Amidohydrolase family
VNTAVRRHAVLKAREMMKVLLRWLLFILLPPLAFAKVQVPSRKPIVFTGATIIDVKSGRTTSDMTIVVVGNRIAALGKTGEVRPPADSQEIDASGKYLIPGLWDMHVHLDTMGAAREIDLPLMVANGVTGVREPIADCMTTSDCLERRRTWQRQIEAGELLGPRLLALGSWAANGPQGLPKGVPEFFGTANADQARQLVRYFAERKLDFVKVYDGIPRAAFFAYADEARKLRLVLMGHQPIAVSAIEASNAGMKSFEHALVFLFNCFPGAAEFSRLGGRGDGSYIKWQRRMVDEYDPKICRDVFNTFVRNDTRYVPTHLTRKMDAFADDPTFRQDQRSKYITKSRWTAWNIDANNMVKANPSPEGRKAMMDFYTKGLEITGAAHKAGVKVMLGTDSGDSYVFPGYAVHDELQELVTAGLTPAEALKTATWNGVEFFGQTAELGSIEKGKLADLILLEANPLTDIRNTRKIAAVILNGQYLDRSALDRLLSTAEAAATR